MESRVASTFSLFFYRSQREHPAVRTWPLGEGSGEELGEDLGEGFG
jgi:hypothetical protein